MLEKRRAYENSLQAQLAQWKADIDVIKARANRAEVGAKIQYDKTLDSLQQTHEAAGHRLRGLMDASDEGWESLKLGTEKAWTEFRTQFHQWAEKI
jgi:hypothetical protein